MTPRVQRYAPTANATALPRANMRIVVDHRTVAA